MSFIKNKRKWMLLGIDLAIFTVVYGFALAIQSFASGLGKHVYVYAVNCISFAALIFVSRMLIRIYSNVWRYANSLVYVKMVIADFIGGFTALLFTRLIDCAVGAWMSVSTVCMVSIATLVSRFVYQQFYRHTRDSGQKSTDNNKIGVAIVGAGQIGSLLAEELMYNHKSHYRPVCFIDKDRDKVGSVMHGLRVYADDDTVIARLRELPVQEIFIALPKITSERAKVLHDFYAKSGCKVKIYDIPLNEQGTQLESDKRVVRELRIEDLLFRDSIKVLGDETVSFYSGKTVLVTGGGGSIGSELCRQIARCDPKRLIIFDIYENNAYDIQQELIRKYGKELDLFVEIGSVRDTARLDAEFSAYRPDIVFHAAAHKHVPLMEHSSCEAIKNNVMGTYNTANAAEKYGVGKFILVSTDKAVNPTNVMGASKRLCEMVIQCRTDSKTTFAAVRFGNVLGSNGSVIPLFKRQIDAGGPVTITDRRIIRYFMTIPEASGLVMTAGAMAKCNELFVLDMGKPVKIIDLAENMIKLSGLMPYRDIDIIETGLRPGEKLYEELLMKTELLDRTDNNLIFIEKDKPLSREDVDKKLEFLRKAVKNAEGVLASESIIEAMMSVVPTYRPPEEVNKNACNSEEMQAVSSDSSAEEKDRPPVGAGAGSDGDK